MCLPFRHKYEIVEDRLIEVYESGFVRPVRFEKVFFYKCKKCERVKKRKFKF